jgi:ParB/RepB/Spo0J family partition protein
VAEAKLTQIRVKEIKPSPFQVRERFDDRGIEELAKSIHMQGLLHPVLVRPVKGKLPYELVHGERRWRAVQKLGKDRILGYIQRLSDLDAEIIALVENVQREDLRPHELSRALKRLRDAGLSYGDISKRTNKSESWIKDLVGFEEEAAPPLKKAVERYYEEGRGRSATPELVSLQKNRLPAVSMKVGVRIARATEELPRIQAKVTQERFAEAFSKHDASLVDADRALKVWEESGRKVSPEKAVQIVVNEREKEQEKAADVVWVQFDKEMQEGVKVMMARENLPSVRDTVLYLVRYALEELDVIPSHR